MEPNSLVSYDWKQPWHASGYTTGVSLHSHTSHSVESLVFIHQMFLEYRCLRPLFRFYERTCLRKHNLQLDFVSAHWRPPLMPRMAFELESQQIRDLGLRPLVSITDHDDIQAPLLLRTMPLARHIPMSLEWSVPFGPTCFHLGIHNLPSASANDWMQRLERYTAAPSEPALAQILAELHALPNVLIILNHPLWDLHAIGDTQHAAELDRFLHLHHLTLHAFELNGLRHARENQQVTVLAKAWAQLLISGGDRHGLEPNANINLTTAANFNEFVHEIRVQRRSHVLFLEQYSRSWEQRLMHSTLDAVVDHPQFSSGWQRWDDRAFHPGPDGVMRPLSELWATGRPPLPLALAIALIRLSRYRGVARAIRMLLPRTPQPEALCE